MATTIYFKNSSTWPRAPFQGAYKDMTLVSPNSTATSLNTDTTTAAPAERPFLRGVLPAVLISERVTAQVTIAGPITFSVRAEAIAGFTGRLRCRVYKLTAGGSDIETFIGEATASADLIVGAVTYSFSVTPPVAVVVAPNERFLVRPVCIPVAGSYVSGNGRLTYHGLSPSLTSVTFTETITFRLNGVTFLCRDTTTIGIGAFRDLSETRNPSGTNTAVVNTTAGGTEIQWTKTAGGAVMEWISPRMAAPGWTIDTIALFGSLPVGVMESNAAANCMVRAKLFRRTPDGTELLVATWDYTTLELPLSNTKYTMTAAMGTLAQVTNIAEDDRFVVRYYIAPFTALTMGGGRTCTLNYDWSVAAGAGDNQLVLLDSPTFKAEGDPPASAGTPSNIMLGGVG